MLIIQQIVYRFILREYSFSQCFGGTQCDFRGRHERGQNFKPNFPSSLRSGIGFKRKLRLSSLWLSQWFLLLCISANLISILIKWSEIFFLNFSDFSIERRSRMKVEIETRSSHRGCG